MSSRSLPRIASVRSSPPERAGRFDTSCVDLPTAYPSKSWPLITAGLRNRYLLRRRIRLFSKSPQVSGHHRRDRTQRLRALRDPALLCRNRPREAKPPSRGAAEKITREKPRAGGAGEGS